MVRRIRSIRSTSIQSKLQQLSKLYSKRLVLLVEIGIARKRKRTRYILGNVETYPSAPDDDDDDDEPAILPRGLRKHMPKRSKEEVSYIG